MHLSFNDTALAYQHLTDKELRRAYVLFRMVGNQGLVKTGKVLTEWALAMHIPVAWIFRNTVFKHFCGGETLEESMHTADKLRAYGVGTILDYAAEGLSNEAAFEKTAQEIIRNIHRASTHNAIPFAVFKVSGIAHTGLLEKVQAGSSLAAEEKEAYEYVEERFDRICHEAFACTMPLFIDAEESWIQDVIDRMALKAMQQYNKQECIIFNTVQLYRHDRLAYLRQLIDMARNENFLVGLKLVRGAYMEKERKRAAGMGYPSPIHPDKAATDACFDESVSLCLNNLNTVLFCLASHNELSHILMAEHMMRLHISPAHKGISSAQLLGMSDNISFTMAKAGYQVAKYVPYGRVKTVIPYLLRRAVENTSVSGQTGRELRGIVEEMGRRKKRK